MLYECTLENASGTVVLAWFKADNREAFRIADAVAAWVNEPLAMLAIVHPDGEPDAKHACSWIIGKPDHETHERLNVRRSVFLAKVNDIFEKYGRGI